jgi:hypothetical protein
MGGLFVRKVAAHAHHQKQHLQQEEQEQQQKQRRQEDNEEDEQVQVAVEEHHSTGIAVAPSFSVQDEPNDAVECSAPVLCGSGIERSFDANIEAGSAQRQPPEEELGTKMEHVAEQRLDDV